MQSVLAAYKQICGSSLDQKVGSQLALELHSSHDITVNIGTGIIIIIIIIILQTSLHTNKYTLRKQLITQTTFIKTVILLIGWQKGGWPVS